MLDEAVNQMIDERLDELDLRDAVTDALDAIDLEGRLDLDSIMDDLLINRNVLTLSELDPRVLDARLDSLSERLTALEVSARPDPDSETETEPYLYVIKWQGRLYGPFDATHDELDFLLDQDLTQADVQSIPLYSPKSVRS